MKCSFAFSLLALALAACHDATGPSSPNQTPAPQLVTAELNNYRAIDLGLLGGTRSIGRSINNNGQLLVMIDLASGDRISGIWQDGALTVLPGLGGSETFAADLNDAGQALGRVDDAQGIEHLVLWDGSSITDLGTQVDGKDLQPGGLNKFGDVVAWGCQRLASGACLTAAIRSYRRAVGGWQEIGTLAGGATLAAGLGDNGDIVGWSFDGSGERTPYVLRGSIFVPLGSLGGATGVARDVNSSGVVVGEMDDASGTSRAFLWNDGLLTNIGSALDQGQSIANAVNAHGWAAGLVQNPVPLFSRAFVWDGNGVELLPGIGGEFSGAFDINDDGRVIGFADAEDGSIHAVLWARLTPIERIEQCFNAVVALETAGVLNRGQSRSLTNKLNGATAMLNDGKVGPAINQLEAFQHEVAGLAAGNNPILTALQAQELTACVEAVIDELSS